MILAALFASASAGFLFRAVHQTREDVEDATLRMTGDANVRECPSTDCPIDGVLEHNESVEFLGLLEGEKVNDTTVWYRVRLAEREGYVHSYYASEAEPSADYLWEVSFTLGLMALTLIIMIVMSSERGRRAVANSLLADHALFLGMMALGVVLGLGGYVLDGLGDEGLYMFLSGSLVNVSMGLIVSAIAFAAFQVFLSDRSPAKSDVANIETRLTNIEKILGDQAAERSERRKGRKRFRFTRWAGVKLGLLTDD